MNVLKSTTTWIVMLTLFSACNSEPGPSKTNFQSPPFALSSLDNSTVSLNDLAGQVTVVHFGTSWCPFCRAEDPHLEALYQKYKNRGVQTLVINVGESEAQALSWKKEAGFSFPMLLDYNGEVAARFAPKEAQPDLPRHEVMIASNLIIDRNGTVRFMSLLDTNNFDARLATLCAHLEEVLAVEAIHTLPSRHQ